LRDSSQGSYITHSYPAAEASNELKHPIVPAPIKQTFLIVIVTFYLRTFEGLSGINRLVAPFVITASSYSRIGNVLSILII